MESKSKIQFNIDEVVLDAFFKEHGVQYLPDGSQVYLEPPIISENGANSTEGNAFLFEKGTRDQIRLGRYELRHEYDSGGIRHFALELGLLPESEQYRKYLEKHGFVVKP